MVEQPDPVLTDLRTFLNDMAGSCGWAQLGVLWGLQRFQETQQSYPPRPENPDPEVHLGLGDPNLPSSHTYQSWRASQIPHLLRDDGPVTIWIGQQWIVGVYTGWEHRYRSRLASAYGCADEDLRHDVLGDLRLMRNDVVHHHGIATAENTGRCAVLRWCNVDEPIRVQGPQIADFMNQFPFDLRPS